MAIALRGTVEGGTDNTTNAVALTLGAAPLVGSLITVWFTIRSAPSAKVWTFPDGTGWISLAPPGGAGLPAAGGVWTVLPGNGGGSDFFYKFAAAGESATVTLRNTGANYKRMCVSEWTGIDSLGPFLAETRAASALNRNTGAVTPTAGREVLNIFGAHKATGSATPSTGSGLVLSATRLGSPALGSFGPQQYHAYAIVPAAAGSYFGTATRPAADGNGEWADIIASFYGAAAQFIHGGPGGGVW